jgi:rRNA maturation endonuclease Nob1
MTVQHVEIEVVDHFAGLPYAGAHKRFTDHVKRCEPCGEAFAAEAECYEFCNKGHELVHAVQRVIDATSSTSVWN